MNINRQNYEVFFIDYFDEKLTAEQVAELMHFISQNPDLAEEFYSFEEVTLPVSKIKFQEKSSLKNISQQIFLITDDTFDTYCIAYIEGDLTQTEKTVFEKYLVSNPEKYKEYKIFTQLKLQQETDIVFENKTGLKRIEITKNYKRIIITGISAAASVIIIFLMYFISSNTTEVQPKYAVRDTNSNKIIIDTLENFTKKTLAIKQNQKNTHYKLLNNVKNNKSLTAENKIKMDKDTLLQENKNIKYNIIIDKIEHLDNKKLIALTVESPVHNNITIYYLQYKKPKKQENSQTLAQFFKTKLQKAVRGENADPNHKFGFIDVADVFVRGINKITGRNMKLQKTYDSKGDVETLTFYSENLQIYKGGKK